MSNVLLLYDLKTKYSFCCFEMNLEYMWRDFLSIFISIHTTVSTESLPLEKSSLKCENSHKQTVL